MYLPSRSFTLTLAFVLGLGGFLRAETDQEKATRLVKARNLPEAQVLLDRLHQADPRNAEVMVLLGEVQFRSGNSDKALEWADRAIQLQPNRAAGHLLRGRVIGNRAQQVNKLRALTMVGDIFGAFEKAVQVEPRNREARETLFNTYLNVPSFAGGGEAKAKAFAEQTVALDPGLGHYWKGLLLQRKKDPGAAKAEYRLAKAADPKLSAIYNGLGYVELEMKQVDMALEDFRKQAELDPTNPNSWDSLGDGWTAKGNLDEAIKAYRKALTLNPLFAASLRSLGNALERSGRRDEAVQHYRQCAQTGEKQGIPEMVKEAKARLKALGAVS